MGFQMGGSAHDGQVTICRIIEFAEMKSVADNSLRDDVRLYLSICC